MLGIGIVFALRSETYLMGRCQFLGHWNIMILYPFLSTLLLLINMALLSPTESWRTNSFLVLPIKMTSLSLALRPSTYAHLLFFIVAYRLQPHHICTSIAHTICMTVLENYISLSGKESVEINLPISWSFCWISKRKLFGRLLIKINPAWYILKTTYKVFTSVLLKVVGWIFTMVQSSKVNLQGNHIFITF